MSRTRQGPTTSVLIIIVAVAVVLLPGLAAASVATQSFTAADRDLLVRVRLAGLWEQPASLAARDKAQSPKVREIAERIASEHHDLDQIVIDAAAQLGVSLPDVPNAAQQGWLDELASAKGEEFDRVYVDRLRAAHGTVFPLILAVRAGTRNEIVRRFAGVAAEYVGRHLSYLDSTDLVDFVTLPPPPGSSPAADDGYGSTVTADGPQLPSDRELLDSVRTAGLWQIQAAQDAGTRSGSEAVRTIAGVVGAEQTETLAATTSVAGQLGLPLPDHPSASERNLTASLHATTGTSFDQDLVENLRRADGELLVQAGQVRAGTRQELFRAFAGLVVDSLLREMTLIEGTGLVDYNDLPRLVQPGLRTSSFERDGGLPAVVLWAILGLAAVTAAISIALKARAN